MSGLTERRGFLQGLASLPLLGGQSLASPADPVVALAARVTEAEREWNAAADEADRLFDVFISSAVEPPEALFHQPKRDWIANFGGFAGTPYKDGRRWYGDPASIEWLRKPRMRQDWTKVEISEDGALCAYVPDEAGQARANEILAAYEEWRAAVAQRRDEIGLTTANQREAETCEVHDQLRDELLEMPARSLHGVLTKAGLGAEPAASGTKFQDVKEATPRGSLFRSRGMF